MKVSFYVEYVQCSNGTILRNGCMHDLIRKNWSSRNSLRRWLTRHSADTDKSIETIGVSIYHKGMTSECSIPAHSRELS